MLGLYINSTDMIKSVGKQFTDDEKLRIRMGYMANITTSKLKIGACLRVRDLGEGGKRFVWMSKELMDKVKGKKKAHGMWEEGLSTWEECRNVVRSCWDVMWKAKAILELNLAEEEVKVNEKCFLSVSKVKGRLRKCGSPTK